MESEGLRMPQYYQAPFAYQAESKFIRITPSNFNSYATLATTDEFTFSISPGLSGGYIFLNHDIEACPRLGMVPVLTLQLRDSGIKAYKQAWRLRIRETFARRNLATAWYCAYVDHMGGIVSDFEHLEGGKALWRSFVETAALRGLTISLVDTSKNEWRPVHADTPDNMIWSADTSKKNVVLVLETKESSGRNG